MSKKRFESVWDAIEDTAEIESMRARAQLMSALIKVIEEQRLTQVEAAKLLGVTQPRVSDLVRGKISLFSLDTLVNMLASAGRRVELKVKREPISLL